MRLEGFYWVRCKHEAIEIAEWIDQNDEWYVCGNEVPVKDVDVEVLRGPLTPND